MTFGEHKTVTTTTVTLLIPPSFIADVFADIQEANLFVSTEVMENTLNSHFISPDISKSLLKICLAV